MKRFNLFALDVVMPDGSVDDELIAWGDYRDDGTIAWGNSQNLPQLIVQDGELMLWFMTNYEYPDITCGDGRWKFVWETKEEIPF
jgi:hypothetical protein